MAGLHIIFKFRCYGVTAGFPRIGAGGGDGGGVGSCKTQGNLQKLQNGFCNIATRYNFSALVLLIGETLNQRIS